MRKESLHSCVPLYFYTGVWRRSVNKFVYDYCRDKSVTRQVASPKAGGHQLECSVLVNPESQVGKLARQDYQLNQQLLLEDWKRSGG